MEDELRAWWRADAGPGPGRDPAFEALRARYAEPHRHYHTLVHVHRVRRDVGSLLTEVVVPDAAAVGLAAWYHDAVYRPGRPAGDDEEASARLAERALTDLAIEPERIAAVARLVRATAHLATDGPAGDQLDTRPPDEQVLLDADLGVLGADAAGYEAYVHGVRREYAHLDDAAWRAGRTSVLDAFLERPRLYAAAAWSPTWAAREARARANLSAERAALTGVGAPGTGRAR